MSTDTPDLEVQWNLSEPNNLETKEMVQIREVS
jgi:hypothetical protein